MKVYRVEADATLKVAINEFPVHISFEIQAEDYNDARTKAFLAMKDSYTTFKNDTVTEIRGVDLGPLHSFGGKKLYVVHLDAYEDKFFEDLTDEEIVKMYEKDPTLVDCYDCVEEMIGNWNCDEFFSPSFSYMRLI